MSQGRWSGRGKIVAAIVGLALGATLFAVKPAQASFPGANGLIAYDQNGAIFTINPNNPIPQAISQQADFDSPNFNATANLLVADTGGGLVTLPPTVGAAVTVVPGTDGSEDEPSFFPSGTKIAFDDAGIDIFSQDLTGANRTNLTAAIADVADDPDVSPNGAFIAFENQTTDQISRIDATGGGFIPALTPATATCAAATDCEAPSWSPNGQFVSYDQDGAPNGIFQVLGTGASANPIRLTTGNDDEPAYAPDGTRVAFQDNNGQLATVPSDGSQATSSLNVDASQPTWGIGGAVVPPGGTPTPTPTPAVVSISLASETKTSCSLALTVVPANATGVTADIVRTKRDGSTILVQDNAAVPGTVTVDKKRKKKTYSLASVQGGTGTGSVVCKKRK